MAACALLLAAPIRRAQAAGAEECAEAHADGQVLRHAGKLLAAADRFLRCAASGCPRPIQEDCASWERDARNSVPTLILRAASASGERVVAKDIRLDGVSVASNAELSVDPGPHSLQFEDAEGHVVSQQVSVVKGEKKRTVVGQFPAPDVRVRAAIPSGAYALLAVSALGITSFTTLAIVGKSRENELRSTCVHTCQPSQVDVVSREYLAADISLAVAVASLAAAAIVILVRPWNHASSFGMQWSPALSGGWLVGKF